MSYDYEYPCNPPAKVVVNGNDIPTINEGVISKARIDGPMDINRLTEVYFPVEWQGHDISEAIKALDLDKESIWEPVDVKLLDPESDPDNPRYITYHRGFPIAQGAGSKGTLERKLRIADPAQLLEGIPFSKSYNYDAKVGDILEDIATKVEENQDIFTDVAHTQIDQILSTQIEEEYEAWGKPIAEPIGDLLGASTVKTFKENKHSLKDAMKYVSKQVNGEFYFTPNGSDQGKISLAYDKERERHFYANNADGDNNNPSPTVSKNNALFEIQPVNTITVNGKTTKGPIDKVTDFVNQEGGEYPTATATYPPLKKLAGQEYKKPTQVEDAFNEGEAQNMAIEKLVDHIEGGGTGEVVTRLFPYINPHDNIYTKPACAHNLEGDVPSLGYTVNEVTHRIGFEEDTERFFQKTHLRVNSTVSEDDIEVSSNTKSI
ncbi:hypothetical protein [Natrinema versiforme]|uniref:Uncharacterized protein n=1 Tax=Natrinema versiforme TaxID=88724 RepID=A0A4P8WHN6_9EURY|nr:hypothetical protein [Natrinema versiforme]QCS42870.1 hypothetical protein FEJ81_11060 [Natrinema versiforme]